MDVTIQVFVYSQWYVVPSLTNAPYETNSDVNENPIETWYG